MDNWERFNETSLPSKESFYSNLNMEILKVLIIGMVIMYLINSN